MNKPKNPPKNKPFLALVNYGGELHWDIFFYVYGYEKADYGVDYVGYYDKMLDSMPDIIRWEYLPEIDL